MAQNQIIPRRLWKIETTHRGVATHSLRTTDVADRIKEVLAFDKYTTSDNMAEELSVSHTTVFQHLLKMGK